MKNVTVVAAETVAGEDEGREISKDAEVIIAVETAEAETEGVEVRVMEEDAVEMTGVAEVDPVATGEVATGEVATGEVATGEAVPVGGDAMIEETEEETDLKNLRSKGSR